jgi:predicted metal-dependent phosphotriesterase family hydrolase
MKLRTVTGDVEVGDVAFADGHGHVWIDPPEGVPVDCRLELNREPAIRRELEDFRAAGGTLIVDCQPGGCGRDGRMLAHISETTGVHITATTGFHLHRYYPATSWLWAASEEEAATYFVEELTVGLREGGNAIKATTLKVGYTGAIAGQSRVLMEAAATAANQTGAIVLFHTEQGQNVEALLPFFDRRGVPADQLYFCHMDKRPYVGLHQELSQAGALLGYDTFVRPQYNPEQNAWPLLKQMVADGFDGGIAIGLDMAVSSMWKYYSGDPGMRVLIDVILPRMRAEGFSGASIGKLAGQNVANRLAYEGRTA